MNLWEKRMRSILNLLSLKCLWELLGGNVLKAILCTDLAVLDKSQG